MRFFTTVTAVAGALLLGLINAQQSLKPLPFDGRIQQLSMDNLDKTYMLHIIKMKPNNGTGKVEDYVKLAPAGRTPAYNNDKGVMTVAVDDKSIFKEMYNFRRTEIVQMIAANPTGTTFFRASIRADAEIKNKHTWQAFFPESHTFDVYVDCKNSTPKLQFLADSWKLQYETEFTYKTWHNVGIAVLETGLIDFYYSSGDAELKKVYSTTKALAKDKIPADYELHFGMLLYSETPNPTMIKDHQDALMFNGISVEKTGPGAAAPAAASPAAPAAASPAAPAAASPAAPAAPAAVPAAPAAPSKFSPKQSRTSDLNFRSLE